MNCNGCGIELDPTEEQVNSSVDQIMDTSLKDAQKTGGVCPLCGHCKQVPYSHRKTVLFGLIVGCLIVGLAVGTAIYTRRHTERAAVANEVLARISSNDDLVRLLGKPIAVGRGIGGEVKHDETGWQEARLTIPVSGPNGTATVHVIGGKGTGQWTFTTFEVVFENQHKKFDLVSGRVVIYEPNAYADVHTEAAVAPEYSQAVVVAAPRFNGEFPCVFAAVDGEKVIPQMGNCAMPTTHTRPVDRFEVDLRYGNFILRQTDLYLEDVFQVPLTRTYVSNDWMHSNPVHAFGRNSNHPYDIAPVGTRNPYTYQMIALEDSDFIYFDRISKGTGYTDAVYQHTETSTRFYKATQAWNGNGWTTRFADGSEIRFPESYNAKNSAQGAPTEMRDTKGNRLELSRDPQRNLQQIKTPNGHWISFIYDGSARILQATDDAGHWARYRYNADGMLTDVFSSSGRERHYSYDRELMTQVADEKQHVLLRNWYESKMLVRQEVASGTYSYKYEWAPKKRYPDTVLVTLPDGSTKKVEIPANTIPEMVRNWPQSGQRPLWARIVIIWFIAIFLISILLIAMRQIPV